MLKNLYEILDISRPSPDISIDSAAIKRAYRKALLQHHPDKVVTGQESEITTTLASKKDVPTIDEITLAYQTLSDTKARLDYDRELLLLQETGITHDRTGNRGVGLEVTDLDDMNYDRMRALWTRACRCGTFDGFVVTEDDLQRAIERAGGGNSHEILVGCSGCSLSLKVNFAVIEEA